ncbi:MULTISPECIES: type II toxin-antitoxin system RelE family toxin [Bacillales]|uniref:type II toxin-antitoxin system RelE family toxin n=1 Tax=Bacillales TaxID=1385 RepID=UPI00119CF0EC|nr:MULTISPECIES: type II toxin-antitoxin system RelE/ParE family toxin [Bacillales]HAJ4038380.1 type II toxin-antitoxin system mRNA interferase toxin, RelE/StbE family [Escherichia coli]
MAYQVVYTKKAIKSLNKIDQSQQRMIIAWIEKNLINTENPKSLGKSLKGNLKEYWRYRVGNYRILADIDNDEIKIIIFNIGHRKDIYS